MIVWILCTPLLRLGVRLAVPQARQDFDDEDLDGEAVKALTDVQLAALVEALPALPFDDAVEDVVGVGVAVPVFVAVSA